MSRLDVEFKALDGTILRGRVYPASQKGAGVVLCPGVGPKSSSARCLRATRYSWIAVQLSQRDDGLA